jgi:hypothetical protein
MTFLPPPPPKAPPRPGAIGRIDVLHDEARALFRQGRLPEAERAHLAMVDVAIQPGDAIPAELRSDVHHWAAVFYRDTGRAVEAEDLARRAVALEEHVGRAGILANHHMFLADLLERRGALHEALEHAGIALSRQRESLGPEHRETAYYASVVARLRRRIDHGPSSAA